jgi:hypothetical protein
MELGFREGMDLGCHWYDYGTLANGQVDIRPSAVPGGGRGLFARVPFAKGACITVYSGEILTAAEAQQRADHSYIMRISDSSPPTFVDGSFYSNGITRCECVDGRVVRYLPEPHDATRFEATGPGPMANHQPAGVANAQLIFQPLGSKYRLLPRVPMLVAKHPIGVGEEIFYDYGTDKPFRAPTLDDENDPDDALPLSERLAQQMRADAGLRASR